MQSFKYSSSRPRKRGSCSATGFSLGPTTPRIAAMMEAASADCILRSDMVTAGILKPALAAGAEPGDGFLEAALEPLQPAELGAPVGQRPSLVGRRPKPLDLALRRP